MEFLSKAIQNAQVLENNKRVQQKIKQAKDIIEELRPQKLFAHDIVPLTQTAISELHRYKEPVPSLWIDVMKATYILLGERDAKDAVKCFLENYFF